MEITLKASSNSRGLQIKAYEGVSLWVLKPQAQETFIIKEFKELSQQEKLCLYKRRHRYKLLQWYWHNLNAMGNTTLVSESLVF